VSKELSKTMQELVAYMREHGGKIHRHPGGFWAKPAYGYLGKSYGTSSVEALVKRGVAQYTQWKDSSRGGGRFPIEATLTG
jgi:hypothetical protein